VNDPREWGSDHPTLTHLADNDDSCNLTRVRERSEEKEDVRIVSSQSFARSVQRGTSEYTKEGSIIHKGEERRG